MDLFFRNSMTRPGAIIALALVGILSGGAAHAAGTVAGTAITNLATLNYSVGGTAQTAIGSSATGNTSGAGTNTSFVVDNKVNLSVLESGNVVTSVVPGASNQVATFTVTNLGNTAQGYTLAAANQTAASAVIALVGDTIDVGITNVFVDSNGNGTYEAGTDAATSILTLNPDASVTVFVLATIPAGATNGQQANVSLTATTTTAGTATAVAATVGADTASVDIVFADAATTELEFVGTSAARDAQATARDAFKVVTAPLTVTKTVVPVCDPFNGNTNPKNIPGSFVRYTIKIENTGLAGGPSATLTSITDTLTTLVAFDSDLIVGATAAACVAGGAPESALLSGIKIVNTARGASYPKYRTTAADADGAGVAPVAGVPTLTVNFGLVLPVEGTYTAGELKATESVSVIYQVKIN